MKHMDDEGPMDKAHDTGSEKSEGYSSRKKSSKMPSMTAYKTAAWPAKIGKPSRNLNAVGWPKVKTSAKTTL